MEQLQGFTVLFHSRPATKLAHHFHKRATFNPKWKSKLSLTENLNYHPKVQNEPAKLSRFLQQAAMIDKRNGLKV